MVVRTLVAAVLVAGIALPARGEPRLEAGGFIGVGWFGARSELGNSWAREQVPGTAPIIGGRLGWLALPALPSDLQIAVEVEVAVAAAFTGDSPRAGRMAFFAPVVAWRGQALARLARWRGLAPHLVIGAGGDTVAPRSPFMARDTDPIAYWGPGLSVPVSGRWLVRVDLRHGVMAARGGGALSTFELGLGFAAAFAHGAPPGRHPIGAADAPRPAAPAAAPSPPDADRDGDGVPDRLDDCPDDPGTRSGIPDDDGCPDRDRDRDGDGIAGAADRCPDQAEDKDGWQDSDGCPDPDNDGDGIADTSDRCPGEPETVNGWEDDDGCPDDLPAEVSAALATAVRFAPGHARVTTSARAALRRLLAVLARYPAVRLVVVGHPERRGGDGLARRRGEAVKWFLVDRGVAEDRITVSVGEPAVAGLALSFHLPAAK